METPLKILRRQISCYYNKVYVIDSLPPKDVRVAEETFTAIQYKLMEKASYSVASRHVSNKFAFLNLLGEIAKKSAVDETPIIHLEIHGNSDGLVTACGDFISWMEIAEGLRPINTGCGHNLLVTLAVCNGAHLRTTVDIKLRAPFWGFIGPTDTINNGEVETLFPEFYRRLLNGENFDNAVRFLLDAKLKSGAVFQFQNCENIFLESIQDINNRFLEVGRYNQFLGKPTNRAYRRKNQSQHKENVSRVLKEEYYKFKSIFFLEDLVPENRVRFNITYEDTLTLPQDHFLPLRGHPIPTNVRPF